MRCVPPGILQQRRGNARCPAARETRLLRFSARVRGDEQHRANVATAFQQAVVDTLVIKSRRALQQTGLRRLVIAGGVSANQLLREQMRQLGQQLDVEVFYPRHEFCTDNGAMIALAGCLRLQAGERTGLAVNTRARWPLAELALS